MDLFRRARQRLQFFVDQRLLPRIPSAWQVAIGSLTMLPVVYGESDGKRARNRRTLLGQIPVRAPLQLLYCPQQAIVGTGLFASRETVLRHVLSVFHEDAMLTYDLQLLQTHEGGLAELERRARRVARNDTLTARFLTGMVGGAGYHDRIAQLASAASRFEYPAPPLHHPDGRFASLVGFASYCLSLPDWPEPEFYGFDWNAVRAVW
jgi:hypothetical protein